MTTQRLCHPWLQGIVRLLSEWSDHTIGKRESEEMNSVAAWKERLIHTMVAILIGGGFAGWDSSVATSSPPFVYVLGTLFPGSSLCSSADLSSTDIFARTICMGLSRGISVRVKFRRVWARKLNVGLEMNLGKKSLQLRASCWKYLDDDRGVLFKLRCCVIVRKSFKL